MGPFDIILLIGLIVFIVFGSIYVFALFRVLIQKQKAAKTTFSSDLLLSSNKGSEIKSYKIGEKLVIEFETSKGRKTTITSEVKNNLEYYKGLEAFISAVSQLTFEKSRPSLTLKDFKENNKKGIEQLTPWSNYKKNLKKRRRLINV